MKLIGFVLEGLIVSNVRIAALAWVLWCFLSGGEGWTGASFAGEPALPDSKTIQTLAQNDQDNAAPFASPTDEQKKKKKKQEKTAPQPSPAPFPVGQAPKKKKNKAPQVETLVTNTGILVPQGKLLVENTFEYVHNSATQVALQGFTVIPAVLIGTINVESVEQDIYMDVLTFYYGITNNLEAEIDVPYVYRTENVLSYPINGGSGNLLQTGTTGNGLGDIEFGFHEQLQNLGQGDLRAVLGRRPECHLVIPDIE